jgi:hypothetical protein
MTLGEVAQLKRVAPETEVRRVAVARGGAQFKGDECVSLAPTMPAREPGVRLLENGGVIWIDLGDDTSRPEILKLSESDSNCLRNAMALILLEKALACIDHTAPDDATSP